MAVMRKEPKDIGELGPIGIVREALKLFAAHKKTYVLIKLVLMLPLAILLLVAEYFVFTKYLPPPPHAFNRGSPSPGARRLLGAGSTFGGGLDLDLKGQVGVFLVSSAISLVFQVAVSLSLSTTIYTVGLHYSGQPVSFVDAVRAAAPRLWIRLSLTTVYVMLLMDSISLLQTVASSLLQEYGDLVPVLWVLVGTIAATILSVVANFGFGILLMISSAVSVLGDDYGWAAMKEGRKLLEGKKKVAILLHVLGIVPGIIEIGLNIAILLQLRKGDSYVDFSPSDLARLLSTGVVFIAWTTFFWELQSLCAGVQYVSFKAYHGESLSNSLYEKRAILVAGYERFGDESKVALLKGALVKGNVV